MLGARNLEDSLLSPTRVLQVGTWVFNETGLKNDSKFTLESDAKPSQYSTDIPHFRGLVTDIGYVNLTDLLIFFFLSRTQNPHTA